VIRIAPSRRRLEEFLARCSAQPIDASSDASLYSRLLENAVAAAEARGGIVRLRRRDGQWTDAARIRCPAEVGEALNPESAYAVLIADVFASGRPKILPANALWPGGKPADEPGDESAAGLLVAVRLQIGDEKRGVIELLLAPDAPPEMQAEVVELLGAFGSILQELERRQREILLANRLRKLDEAETFIGSVYQKLSRTHVAHVVANDGKLLLACDRVSVLLERRGRLQLEAVSGLDIVEKRSEAAKLLARLAKVVCEADVELRYPGNPEELTPQIREALEEYVDATHVCSAEILPLKSQRKVDVEQAKCVGVLVIEQLETPERPAGRTDRARYVAEHAARALANATAYERIPLHFLRRAWERVEASLAPKRRTKTLWIAAAIVAASAALAFVPADFEIHSQAVLRPSDRHFAFAPQDGIVKRILVRHGNRVTRGTPLVEMRNVELDVAIADVAGQWSASREELSAVERSLYEDGTRLTTADRHRLSGRRSELKQRVASLAEQRRILEAKREQLVVRSPADGEVTTWNVELLLAERPVRQGQALVEVSDTAGPWELEVQVPEDDVGHVIRAQAEHGTALPIRYRSAVNPSDDRTARIEEVHLAAEVRGENGNTVIVRAALEGERPLVERSGAEASAKIYCGRRSLGYVWLHDAVDFVRRKILFRIS
jgi:hypothetical protein